MMNDFTKEELQMILFDMTAYSTRTTILAESLSHKALRDKLQSMIDNYCEHKWQMNNQLRCNKCGVKVG